MTLAAPIPGTAGILPAPASKTKEPRWSSRGYLPHYDAPETIQMVTFRLHDSVPRKLIEEWRRELAIDQALPTAPTPGAIALRQQAESELRQRLLKYEDAGHGACFLRDPRVAGLVETALLHFNDKRYHLIAWCVMPNHVHAVFEPAGQHAPSDILFSWKSYTATQANRLLKRDGAFWMREYMDRFIRSDQHLANTIEYIENNPVKAGLAAAKTDWPWSSAGTQARDRGILPAHAASRHHSNTQHDSNTHAGRMPAVPNSTNLTR